MRTLVVVDAQNEFSAEGLRATPHAQQALAAIQRRVAEARRTGAPIAWVRHHNTPADNEGQEPAFVPGAWGADYMPSLGPQDGNTHEREFVKDVFGAFTGSPLGAWLEDISSNEILLVGFYTHMCVSTTAREGLMRGLHVAIDPDGTGSAARSHPLLGEATADEMRRTALLQLQHMGAEITPYAG